MTVLPACARFEKPAVTAVSVPTNRQNTFINSEYQTDFIGNTKSDSK
jgi:hypothetical protein